MQYHEAIGLDLGEHSARVVHARRQGMGRVVFLGAGRVRLAADPEESLNVLQRFLTRNGWDGLPCVIGLRGASILLRPISIEANGTGSMQEALARQLEHFDGMAGADTLSAQSPVRRLCGTRRALFAVTRRELIDRALDRARRIGLRVIDIHPDPVALYNAAAEALRRIRAPIACADIGHDGTDVVIGQDGVLLFARHIPIGRRDIDVAGDGADRGLSSWLKEIQSCLEYHRTHERNRAMQPGQLILCGEPHLPEELPARMREITGLPVRPFSSLAAVAALEPGSRFATATGLALAGLGRSRVRISLLPPALREKLTLEWQLKYWVGIGAVLLLTMLIWISGLQRDISRRRTHLVNTGERLAAYRALESELAELQRTNGSLRKQLTPLRTAVRNGELARALLQATAAAKHPDDWLILVSDARSYFGGESAPARPAGPSPSTAAAPSAGGETAGPPTPGAPEGPAPLSAPEPPARDMTFRQIVLEGYTPVPDLSTVRGMIEKLRNYPFIASVDLLADDRVRVDVQRNERWKKTNGRLFALEITVGTTP